MEETGRPVWFNVEYLWHDLIGEMGRRQQGSDEHAVEWEWSNDRSGDGWWRYLVGHLSKSKKSQLGYQGKQWGIINRDKILWPDPLEVKMDDRSWYRLRRVVRRMCRMKRGLRRLSGRTDVLISGDVRDRVIAWAVNDSSRK